MDGHVERICLDGKSLAFCAKQGEPHGGERPDMDVRAGPQRGRSRSVAGESAESSPQHCASQYSALRASPLAVLGAAFQAFPDAAGRGPCFAQARGDCAWLPVKRMRLTHGRIYRGPGNK